MSPRAPDPTPDAPASTPGPLLVELVGPAGIGKSAVARLVERGDTDGERRLLAGDALERHDRLKGGQAVLARKGWARSWAVWRAARCRPAFADAVSALVTSLDADDGRRRRMAQRAMGHLRMLVDLARDGSTDGVLVDQGITNMLWSITVGVDLKDDPRLRAVLDAYLDAVDVRFVLLRADPAVVTERVFAREAVSRFSARSDARTRAAFPRWLANQGAIEAMLPERRIIARMETTDADAETVAGRVRAQIEPWLSARSRRAAA